MVHRTDKNFVDPDVIVLSSDDEEEVNSGPAPINNRNQSWRFRSPSTAPWEALGHERSSANRYRLAPRQMPYAVPNRPEPMNPYDAPIADRNQSCSSWSAPSGAIEHGRFSENRRRLAPRQMSNAAPDRFESPDIYYKYEIDGAPAPITNSNRFRDNAQGHSRSRSPSTAPSGSLGHGRSSAYRPCLAPRSAPRQMPNAAPDCSESMHRLLERYKYDLAQITAHRDALQQRVDRQATVIEQLNAALADSDKAKEAIARELANQRNSRGKHLADCLVENRKLRDKISEAEKAKIRAELETEKMQKELNMYQDPIQEENPGLFEEPSASKYSGSSDDDELQDPRQL